MPAARFSNCKVSEKNNIHHIPPPHFRSPENCSLCGHEAGRSEAEDVGEGGHHGEIAEALEGVLSLLVDREVGGALAVFHHVAHRLVVSLGREAHAQGHVPAEAPGAHQRPSVTQP